MAVLKTDLDAIKAAENKMIELAVNLSTAPDFVKRNDTSATIDEAVSIYESILNGQKELIKLCNAVAKELDNAYIEFSAADTGAGKMISTL